MNTLLDLDCNFKSKRIKSWFNNNYFIAVYDLSDNYIIGFENIEDPPQFFNIPLFRILEAIRNNMCIEHNHHKYKLYIYEKEKENEIKERGRKR